MSQLAERADRGGHLPPTHSLQSQADLLSLDRLPDNSEQELRFVQGRLALFGKTTFFVSAMFLLATTSADLLGEVRRMSEQARASHVLGTLVALGLWLVLRSGRSPSASTLDALDITGTLGISVTFVLMGHLSVQPYGFYTSVLAVTHVSVSRAMIVPSHPWRTLWLGAASFAGLIVSRATLPLPFEMMQTMGSRTRGLLEAVLWSTAGSAVATVASKVIYGLQEKARVARQLGQYTLESKIGGGGMGEIYRARHAMLRRPTAIKLLFGNGSEEQLRRFEKEVQLTARLTHPNTISIYDYGRTPDGIFYYAMELLDGLSLEQLVERHGPQPAGRVIHILLQVCGALSEAHRVGLIHRDIKPANIHLCRRGDMRDFVKVLDFGLVREVKSAGNVTHSNTHAVVGTPLYWSPEAILTPDDIDARADIYGLGGVAYFLLTGTPAFSGSTAVELGVHHLHTVPEPPSKRQPVPEDLERVILACLAKDRGKRPQSAKALSAALGRCRDARSWTEADAEVWWGTAGFCQPEPAAVPLAHGPLRRTVCCVDIERRLESEKGRARRHQEMTDTLGSHPM